MLTHGYLGAGSLGAGDSRWPPRVRASRTMSASATPRDGPRPDPVVQAPVEHTLSDGAAAGRLTSSAGALGRVADCQR